MFHYELYIFIDTCHSQGRLQVEKAHQEPPFVFSYDIAEEKVVVIFQSKKSQDEIYEVTLCKYLDTENELPIDPSIRFLCNAHPVS